MNSNTKNIKIGKLSIGNQELHVEIENCKIEKHRSSKILIGINSKTKEL